jgi:hypothetical protein
LIKECYFYRKNNKGDEIGSDFLFVAISFYAYLPIPTISILQTPNIRTMMTFFFFKPNHFSLSPR